MYRSLQCLHRELHNEYDLKHSILDPEEVRYLSHIIRKGVMGVVGEVVSSMFILL